MECGPPAARRAFDVRALLFGFATAAVLAVGCAGPAQFFAVRNGAVHDAAGGARDGMPAHLLTWIDADQASPAPPWPTVSNYLDFAIVGQSLKDLPLAQALESAGIGVVTYTNPNHQAQSGKPHFPDNVPSDFAHECDGARIYRTGFGEPTPPPGPPPTPKDYATYLMDPHSSHLAQSWSDEVTGFIAQSGVTPAYVFEDTADSIRDSSGMPCRYAQPDWTTASATLDETMIVDAALAGDAVSIVYNGLGTPQHPTPTHTPSAFGLNGVTAGGMAENCYSRQQAPTPNDPDPPPEAAHGAQWLDTEFIELSMAAAHKLFVCNAHGSDSAPAETLTGLRTYVIASVLLTYDPATTVLDEGFVPASGFDVFPESTIVALEPLAPPPSDVSQLVVGGVYARQYAECYVRGSPIGACAAIVNPSVSATYPFPFPGAYAGTLKLVGGGVLDAGAKVKTVTGLPSHIGPRGAVIVFAPAPSPTP